jgi:hypothetical protein
MGVDQPNIAVAIALRTLATVPSENWGNTIAQILFYIFLAIFVISLIMNFVKRA